MKGRERMILNQIIDFFSPETKAGLDSDVYKGLE
jgi:hypothetical protein